MRIENETFVNRIAKLTGKEIYRCFQCRKCSSGCPVAEFMDLLPAQIIRLVQFGFKEKIFSSETIWICASCETCTTRCPNEIDIALIMDTLRQECIQEGYSPAQKNVYLFHRIFMASIKDNGKIHELGMIKNYKQKTGTYFEDIKLGLKMFAKGKIKIFPHKTKGLNDIRRILDKY